MRWFRSETLRARLTRVLLGALIVPAVAATVMMVAFQIAAQQRQLDASLHAHALSETLTAIDRADHRAHLHDAPMAVAGSDVALDKFAALYDAEGNALASTSSFARTPPSLRGLPIDVGFDLGFNGRRLRAVIVRMGNETAARSLLLAVPRREIDRDTVLLVALGVLSVLAELSLAWFLARALARWFTRDLDAIATAARAVAAGNLDARVGPVGGVREVRALASDLDEMIRKLAAMVASQRRFVSDAAHELRTPLTALRGETELALLRPRDATEYRAALERIHGDVIALGSLAEELLALARARTRAEGTPTSDVREAARDAARAVDVDARAREVTVNVSEHGTPALAAIRARDAERVIRNLLENAVRYGRTGGAVHVTVGVDRERVFVQIVDDGTGVPIEQAERIFEPFVRLDVGRPREGGAGLGLPIARELARAAGGDVALDTGFHGPGARFVAWFPVAPDTPAASATDT